jgi:pimeloyl-ACP methyl ester carboxylesterase
LETELAFFPVAGGEIHYEEHGRGAPPMVFVHGLACALEDWRYQTSHFSRRTRVVCLDQRGHGRSHGHDSGFDIATFAADVAALMAELRLPPALLVGHSMGCRVVLECASSFPDRVAGLVLIDGSRLASDNADAAREATRIAMQDSGYQAFLERLFSQMFTDASDRNVRDAAVARAKQLPAAVGLELTPAMVAWDAQRVEHALDKVKVPLQIIQSTYLNEARERVSMRPDETIPWLELVRSRVPQAEVSIVPGIGHFTMLEAPDAVTRNIEALLDALEGNP